MAEEGKEQKEVTGVLEVKASVGGEVNRKLSTKFDFKKTLAEAVEAFGENVVFALFQRAGVTSCRNYITAQIRAKVEDVDIETALVDWKPPLGVVRVKVSPQQRLISAFPSMSDEEKKAFIADLKGLM